MKRTFIITVVALFLSTGMKAQEGEIIYENHFEPDVIYANYHNSTPYYKFFDFDKDGTDDLVLIWIAYKFWHITGYTYNDWWYYSDQVPCNIYVIDSNTGDTVWFCHYNIGDIIPVCTSGEHENRWHPAPENPDEQAAYFAGLSNNSEDSTMIAFRKPVDEGWCYGWIRISVDGHDVGLSNRKCTIHDYAYCTVPNYPLRFGQTSFDWNVIENPSKPFASLHPNPTTGLVTIKGDHLLRAEVFNILGQKVASDENLNGQLTLDIGNLPPGVYLVSVTNSEGKTYAEKIVKQ